MKHNKVKQEDNPTDEQISKELLRILQEIYNDDIMEQMQDMSMQQKKTSRNLRIPAFSDLHVQRHDLLLNHPQCNSQHVVKGILHNYPHLMHHYHNWINSLPE